MLPVALARRAAATALLLLLLLDEGSGMGVPGGGCRATRGSCVVSGAVAAAGAAARLGVSGSLLECAACGEKGCW